MIWTDRDERTRLVLAQVYWMRKHHPKYKTYQEDKKTKLWRGLIGKSISWLLRNCTESGLEFGK